MFANNPVDRLNPTEALSFTVVESRWIHLRRVVYWSVALLVVFAHLLFVFIDGHFELNIYANIGVKIISWSITSVFVFIALIVSLSDPKKAYLLRDHDCSYRRGIIFRKNTTQPIVRIQHVEINQGPLERKYNLASLSVYSAGGAAHTFRIPGLDHDHARNMRSFILSHKESSTHV